MGRNRNSYMDRLNQKRRKSSKKNKNDKKYANNAFITNPEECNGIETPGAIFDYSDFRGAIKNNFDPRDLIVKMEGHFFFNSTNIVDDLTRDRLISAPKFEIEEIEYDNELLNLNKSFCEKNKSKSKKMPYYFKDTHFYAILTTQANKEPITEIVAISTTNMPKVKSVSLAYLPEGDTKKAIFIARFCHHDSCHPNTDGTIIQSNVTHVHLSSEKYYRSAMKSNNNKKNKELAKKFVHPNAYAIENVNSLKDMITTANEAFNVRTITVHVSTKKHETILKSLVNRIKKIKREERKAQYNMMNNTTSDKNDSLKYEKLPELNNMSGAC